MNALLLTLALLQPSTLDADGWTVLTPSADSRTIYVSSSTGNDANSGLTEAAPLKTIAKAFTIARDGYPDFVLLKRGDTFSEGRLSWYKGGRSATDPLVVTSYGTGERPILSAMGFLYWGPNGGPTQMLDFLTFSGLQFRADWENNQTSTPHTNAFLFGGGLNSFLIEDCLFSGYREAVQIDFIAGGMPVSNVTIRRNTFFDDSAQGVLSFGANGITIEENIFDRIGWKLGQTNIFRHGVYVKQATHCKIVGNIFARCSNFGSKLSCDLPGGFTDFEVANNMYYNCTISLDHSQGSTGDVQTTFTHQRGLIKDNVITEVARTFETGVKQDIGAWVLNTKDVEWASNLFVHKPPFAGNPLFTWREHHENISVHDTIVYDWNLLGPGSPRIIPQDYLESNASVITNYTLTNNELDTPASNYADPTRTVGSYYASIGGTNDPVAFATAIRVQCKDNWNPTFTADAVNDYIRAGFLKAIPIPNPDPVPVPDPPPTTYFSRLESALISAAKAFITEMEK